MSYCPACGRQSLDGGKFCVGCGSPLAGGSPPPPIHSLNPVMPGQQLIVDNEQLRLISMFHFIYAGLAGAGFMFLCVHFLFMRWIFRHASEWGHGTTSMPPERFLHFMGVFYFFGGVLLLSGFFLNLASASFLRQRTHRMFSLVVAGINCLHIPFGTALGVWSIMALMRDSVRRLYEGPRA